MKLKRALMGVILAVLAAPVYADVDGKAVVGGAIGGGAGAAVGSAIGGREGAIVGGAVGGAAGAAIATSKPKETVVTKEVVVEKEVVHVHHHHPRTMAAIWGITSISTSITITTIDFLRAGLLS
jgi:outer membrane lipoprotein SlyB